MASPATPTRFAIWFNQRSGSSHLAGLLDSHPKVRCAHELFYGNEHFNTEDVFTRSGCGTIEEFLDLFSTPRSAPTFWSRIGLPQLGAEAAVGFKVKYEQALDYPLVQALRQRPTSLIHLLRNPLAVYTSLQALTQVTAAAGDANVPADSTAETSTIRVRLDPDLTVWEVHRIVQAQAFGRYVSGVFRTLEVHYEDLVAAPQETLARIQHFIGVPDHPLTAQWRKALPPTLEEAIVNYGEIHDALAATELGPMVL